MFPIIAHGRNLQDEYTEEVTSYLGLSARMCACLLAAIIPAASDLLRCELTRVLLSSRGTQLFHHYRTLWPLK